MAVHYVDNQKFLEEIIEYQNQRNYAKEAGEELPPCPESVSYTHLTLPTKA